MALADNTLTIALAVAIPSAVILGIAVAVAIKLYNKYSREKHTAEMNT